MEPSLNTLTEKIDQLTAQVSYLSEQAKLNERQRLDRAELMRDITPIANQAFALATEQLEEVQEYIDLGDLLRLFKRLLRNGRNLEKMLDQMESLADLIDTLAPLADEAFSKTVDLTANLEAKGYFNFARGGMHMLDSLVASVRSEELDDIAGGLGPIMALTRNTVADFNDEAAKPLDSTYSGLVRQLRDPAVRTGLAFTLRLLKVIGIQAAHLNQKNLNNFTS